MIGRVIGMGIGVVASGWYRWDGTIGVVSLGWLLGMVIVGMVIGKVIGTVTRMAGRTW